MEEKIRKTVIGRNLTEEDFQKWNTLLVNLIQLKNDLNSKKELTLSVNRVKEFTDTLKEKAKDTTLVSWVDKQLIREFIRETYIGKRLPPNELESWILAYKTLSIKEHELIKDGYEHKDFVIFINLFSEKIDEELEATLIEEILSTSIGNNIGDPQKIKAFRELLGNDTLEDFKSKFGCIGKEVPDKDLEDFYQSIIKL